MPIIAATIHKETQDDKTGLRVTHVNGVNQIHEIVPGSLFARNAPHLYQGMRIVSVNNVQCDGKSSAQVTQLIKDAQGAVVLLVDDAEPDIAIPQSYDLGSEQGDAVATVPQATIVTETAVSNYSPPTKAPTNVGANRPPSGVPAGGTWGTAKYIGERTKLYTFLVCLCFPPFCCYVVLCPQDEKDAYRIKEKVSVFCVGGGGTRLEECTNSLLVLSFQLYYCTTGV